LAAVQAGEITPANSRCNGFLRERMSAQRKVFALPSNADPAVAACRTLIDCVTDQALFLIDAEGVIRQWFEGSKRLFGYQPDEVVGLHLSYLFPKKSAFCKCSSQALSNATRAGRFTEESWCVRSDGKKFWGHITLSAPPGNGEQPAYLAVVIRDESEAKQLEDTPDPREQYVDTVVEQRARQKAEEELRRSRETLRAVVDNIPIAVFWKDRECRYLGCNATAAAYVGVDRPAEIVGKTDFDLPCTPEEARYFQECDRRVMENDRPEYHICESLRLRDGKVLTLDTTKVPLHDTNGNVVGVVGIFEDVTERKRNAEALKRSQRMLHLVMDNIPQGIFWKDRNSVYLGCNRVICRALGFDNPEQIIGKTDRDMPFLAPSEAEFFIAKDREVMEHRRPQYHIIEPFTLPDGRTIWLSTSKIPLQDEDGNVIGILGSWEDITERRALEEQLRHSQKMEAVGQLAGGIAHDFNNLLTVILGYSDLLMSSVSADALARDCVSEIRLAGERAAALTRQLLAFSRKQMLEPKIVDINEIVSASERMLRRLIAANIRITTVLEPLVSRVRVDSGQFEQVVLNLSINARDAMPHGGELTITTRNVALDEAFCRTQRGAKPGEYIAFSVRDNGCGMTPEVKARIFEPFFTTKAPGKGTGLGLATVYGIVEQSSGFITVESEPGAGAEFTVYLPAVDVAESIVEMKEHDAALRGNETIMLVEDEECVRKLTKSVLESQGYTLLEASNGLEALQTTESYSYPIHLLITDVVMPEVGGRELARRMRDRRPLMKVLFVSGYSDQVVTTDDETNESITFLQKPFSPLTLLRKLRSILDARPNLSSGSPR